MQNNLFSPILILAGIHNLFHNLLFLVGTWLTLSITGHHHISLTVCLLLTVVLTQTRQSLPTPGRPLQSPSFLLTHARPSCQLPAVLVSPAVLTSTLPSSDATYSPPHNPGRPSLSRQSSGCLALDRTTASGPVLSCSVLSSWCFPRRPCGAPGRFGTLHANHTYSIPSRPTRQFYLQLFLTFRY